MQDYAESIDVILGQREELRALVVAGECFERQAQAGTGRWVGNSKHFLEEERPS
ncbi:ANKRD17 [Symbiodinium sp. CCMP2592]|nr:ANKRD17 [Symbiodinium sp. CCMP2592]